MAATYPTRPGSVISRIGAVWSALALVLMPASAASAQAIANDNPAFLQVYVNNIENLTGSDPAIDADCRSENTDLIEYIKTQDYAPDLFIVQQISNAAQAETYAQTLQEELDPNWNPADPDPDYDYHFVIAEADPTDMTNGGCLDYKAEQTNAVFFRTARLTLADLSALPNLSPNPIVWQTTELENCDLNNQSRTKAVAALFLDTLTGNAETAKRVAAGSMHWVTQGSGGRPQSSVCNIREMNDRIDTPAFGPHIIIFGGDANDEDRMAPGTTNWWGWYQLANGSLPGSEKLGYTDPIYDLCRNPVTGQADPACLDANLTFVGTNEPIRRIDFLFARQPGSANTVTTNPHTIGPEEADLAALATIGTTTQAYSDHRAIRSRVYYDDPLVFRSPHPIVKPSVLTGEGYLSATLADDVADAGPNALLDFSLLSGPEWLTVEPNGALGGMPGCGDIGINEFIMRVSNQSKRHDNASMAITVTDAARPSGGLSCPRLVHLSEVLYDPRGSTENNREWVELYNSGSNPIDLSNYSLGYGGGDYADGTADLSGIIRAGQTFVVGGPVSNNNNANPFFSLESDFAPNLQNSGNRADGMALFNVPASDIIAGTVPIDAVVYGTRNLSGLIDESGVANAPDVGDVPGGQSIERVDLAGAWREQPNPTPNQASLAPSMMASRQKNPFSKAQVPDKIAPSARRPAIVPSDWIAIRVQPSPPVSGRLTTLS